MKTASIKQTVVDPNGRRISKFLMVAAAVWSTTTSLTAQSSLAGLDLRSAGDYAFVHLGNGNLGWNSGPIAGDVIFGLGLNASLSGGNNGGLSNGGILHHDNTASISGSLENPVTKQLVSASVTQTVAEDALRVSNYANSLSPTQIFKGLDGATVFGNGGLNVIEVGLVKNELTITGGSDDFFVFNVSDKVDSNKSMNLVGGITPDRVLFNLTGTGTVFQTAGGNASVGTFLATNGGSFQFSNLVLDGALINTGGGDVQFVSGARIPTFTSFTVPEPSSAALLAFGFAGAFLLRKR